MKAKSLETLGCFLIRSSSTAVVMTAVAFGGAGAFADDFTSLDYSQDGIIAQWDGIDNAISDDVRSHDAEATTWPNLVNPTTKITLGSGDVVGAKAMTIVAARDFSGIVGANTNGPVTVEICAQCPTRDTFNAVGCNDIFYIGYRIYCGYYCGNGVNGGCAGYVSYSQTSPSSRYFRYGIVDGHLRSDTVTNAHTFAGVARMGSGCGFYDGEAQPFTASALTDYTGGTVNGNGKIGNANYKPEIFAIRVYSRELTAEEIRIHAMIDRARFLGVTDEIKKEGGVVKYCVTAKDPDGSTTAAWYVPGATATVSYSLKSGETFRFWKHAPETSDRTQNPLSFTVTRPLTVEARLVDPYRLTAASYVQEGLVLAYDGLANGGVDADGDDVFIDKAGIWKDLSPYHQDAKAYANEAKLLWHDGGCDSFAGGYMKTGYYSFTGSPELVEAGNNIARGHTAQMCGKKGVNAGGNCYANIVGLTWWKFYMPNMTTGLSMYERNVAVSVNGAAAQTHTAVTTTFTTEGAPANTGFMKRWFGADNYQSWNQTTASMNEQSGTSGNIFAAGYYDQPFFLNSARFYNRVLSDYERMLNTRIDEERFLASNATRIVSIESSSENFGTPVGRGYGTYRVEPGEAVSCSFTDSLETYEDGISAIRVTDGERTAVLGYVVSNRVDASYESAQGASAFAGTARDDFRLIWQWNPQFKITYVASSGGTVTAAKASGSWFNAGTTVTLTAVPDDAHKFSGWAGDIDGIADISAATIVLPVDRARSVTAVFDEKYHTPVSLTWQGGAEGSWSNPANWGGVLPQEGDTVTIGGEEAVTVTLDMATPVLGEVTVAKTLVSAGWASALRANAVTVAAGGVVTCAGGFGSMSPVSNRVWIVCDTLTVEAGGSINVNKKGWATEYGELGAGPGGGGAANSGGAYGGFGGAGYVDTEPSIALPDPYGDATDPRDPGSAGSANSLGSAQSRGGNGGGVVLVQATGAVTVNGSITANGENGVTSNSSYTGGGSGGGISIHCGTISGSGTLSARGGSAAGSGHGGHGSGGRIAVHYDPVAQAALAKPTLTFDAGTPTSTDNWLYEGNHINGEDGTVWLPDQTLVREDFNVTGQLMIDGAQLTLPSMTLNGRRVAFNQEGFTLTVAGDVVLKSAGSALHLGGSVLTRRPYGCTGGSRNGFRRFGGATPISVTIGGDLRLQGSKNEVVFRAARLDYEDADPADGIPRGGTLRVGGRLAVTNNTRVVCVSHYATGVSPRIEAKNLDVFAGGTITASGQGYYARNSYTSYPLPDQTDAYSFGPGSCKDFGTPYDGPGGSHLGLGGHGGTVIDSKYLYDDSELPHMPGSAGNGYAGGGHGGGVIWLDVSRNCRLYGTLSAVGETTGSGHAVGSAGGAICVRAHKLYLDAAARINANGGPGAGSGGAGGGGGVALYRAFDQAGSAITAATVPQDLVDAVLVTASAGTAGSGNGKTDGTVHLGRLPALGTMILVR